MPEAICPECDQGKCINCDGTAWNNELDIQVACSCSKQGHK